MSNLFTEAGIKKEKHNKLFSMKINYFAVRHRQAPAAPGWFAEAPCNASRQRREW